MKPSDLSGKAAIVSLGYELVNSSLGHKRISAVELQTRAALKAIETAGIHPQQIGALYTGRSPVESMEPQWNMVMLDALKLAPKSCTSVLVHGAGALSALRYAVWSVCTGTVDYALCTAGSVGTLWQNAVSGIPFYEVDPQFEAPYQPLVPTIYAQFAARYAYEFGITPAQAARVAVESRKWGVRHPYAAMRDKGLITVDDVLKSDLVSTPFRKLDCAPWYPGGVGTAVIVARSEDAERLTDRPIYIKGFGECSTHETVSERMSVKGVAPFGEKPTMTTSGIAVAAADAYEMAGWTASDIQIAHSQTPFTYMLLMTLEDLGFCEKGQAGHFVEAGGIDFEGGLPFNTNGGMLSFGQPNNPSPMLVEAIEQMLGEAKGRQVENADRTLVHFHGGPFSSHSVMLLSNSR